MYDPNFVGIVKLHKDRDERKAMCGVGIDPTKLPQAMYNLAAKR